MTAAAHIRNLVGPLVRRAYRIRVTGSHHLPLRGQVLVVASHPGPLDALVLATCTPRPIRMLVDSAGPPGAIRVVEGEAGGPPLREAVAALRGGEAVGVFPEGGVADGSVAQALPAAAYLQVRTEAPVVPVALFGTRGERMGDPPRPRSTVDVVIGSAFIPDPPGDELSRAAILGVSEQIRQRLADHVRVAAIRTGHPAERTMR